MFRFFKRKPSPPPEPSAPAPQAAPQAAPPPAAAEPENGPQHATTPAAAASAEVGVPPLALADALASAPAGATPCAVTTAARSEAADALPPERAAHDDAAAPSLPGDAEPQRRSWTERLRSGLRKTGSSIAQVFTGARIDDALYDELEAALLMSDAGVGATEHLLADLKRRVKAARATEPQAVKALLADAIAELLAPLERGLAVGRETPTVIMVVGVNGAGKTTTIGKLTRHLAEADRSVLLAAADTFRAAAREQLAVWADRNRVEIVSQQGGDPAAVSFDAVTAGKARGVDVVIADTAGRLTTQPHLMEELKKIQRTIGKAMPGAPHEVLLIVDGNTGQNALAQVKAFDAALGLTGLVVTKLDGTAKGGVLAAIALWSRERAQGAVPVYFIGVGEKLEDLQTFSAREFAQALLG